MSFQPPELPENKSEDTIVNDWRWLAIRCERRLHASSLRPFNTYRKPPRQFDKGGFDISQFTCFVPRTVLEAIVDKRIGYAEDYDIIVEQFNAAVVFCDASGFTPLTEELGKQPNGAEKLGECINNFFTPLIQIIHFWGGDIIKFSGDALTIVWPVDDESDPVIQPKRKPWDWTPKVREDRAKATDKRVFPEDPLLLEARGLASPKGPQDGLEDPGDEESSENESVDPSRLFWGMSGREEGEARRKDKKKRKRIHTGAYEMDKRRACKLAIQCCQDIHKKIGHFPTPVPDRFFTLHIGVGYGKVTILQVGGTLGRWEYVVAGAPMQEIALAEPLAGAGETVVSASVLEIIRDRKSGDGDLEAEPIAVAREWYGKVNRLRGTLIPPPPPLQPINVNDEDVELIKRFIPPAVYKRLTAGYNVFVNELRYITTVFVGVRGLDVGTDRGSRMAHRLMQLTQRAAYTMEGSVNKFLVDDKGVSMLIAFGLPPVYHPDDPIRAIMASLRVCDGLRTLGLSGGIGVATGKVWCGTVGCDERKEYTAMGDAVNLSARLMMHATGNEIRCDLTTKTHCEGVMDFRVFPPVKFKGKGALTPIFQPLGHFRPEALLRRPRLDPIATWPYWRHKAQLRDLIKPRYRYRQPIPGVDKILMPDGHLLPLPWDDCEPWLPSLRSTIDLGGVMVIKGGENQGTMELVHVIEDMSASLDREFFLCSNMPTAPCLNIGNVPLLVYRKLCTDMIYKWRNSRERQKKGLGSRGASIHKLLKELTHPIFHWRLREMKPVINGLVLEEEMPTYERLYGSQIPNYSEETRFAYDGPDGVLPRSQEAPSPIICSLVNEYASMHPSMICVNVRSGTSLYANMDSESWKTTRLIAKTAMTRRKMKVERDTKAMIQWRKEHSSLCLWCLGHPRGEYVDTREGRRRVEKTIRCQPPASDQNPPLVLVVVCSNETDVHPEQRELIHWAKECNSYIDMDRFTVLETASYLAHCLQVNERMMSNQLVEYVHRISGGIPRYIYLTSRQLRDEGAIKTITDTQPIRKSPFVEHPDTSLEHRVRRLRCAFGTTSDTVYTYILAKGDDGVHITKVVPVDLYKDILITREGLRWAASQWRSVTQGRQTMTTSEVMDGQLWRRLKKNEKIGQGNASDTEVSKSKAKRMKRRYSEDDPGIGFDEAWESKVRVVRKMAATTVLAKVGNLLPSKRSRRHIGCRGPKEFYPKVEPSKYEDDHVTAIRHRHVKVVAPLRRVPLIPELVARAMSMMERLEADEQLTAKVAAIFPVPFTVFDLQIVFPRPLRMFPVSLAGLVRKEILQITSDPPQDEFEPFKAWRSMYVPDQEIPVRQEDLLAWTPEAFDCLLTPINPTKTYEEFQEAAASLEPRRADPEGRIEPKWGFDNRGNPIYLRFTSIAFQQVVVNLLLTDERNYLSQVARKAVMLRRTYGCKFLSDQIYRRELGALANIISKGGNNFNAL